ncbi:flagellar motor switch protein FliM [Salisediminibacterium halotolerans]|uniref:Flagellar motor switch protein FliM n=1 Tax=Salisediminibacterium halotolerans TaxID=517425 RepID=A0A1H9Q6G9_9BACI|nr:MULTISPECIES: flagellar motor switch protein FliM [Salisediminibacterium]RLJ74211.1 flagellar motor switch protein FliM [Actinophytocola xinjiangensis]RPE87696.1 flagellar motor switch protein FliM [Salisediminibacterium halotolerans]TWG35048.1 flagellar motor switch protein FliM [Salisediminibacterium halotolerans]SER55443.1 flagellar motor switch protein FliM [Salisediminibacterium haloalkalitolerans]GEL06665.1 flagellar motor switch protein FliM [Salisediminibacterium halotolerans]
MADVLSQGEIDALLSALSTGEMDADELKKEDEEKKVKTYDFKRALRFSKDQIRSLTRIHENFARLLTTQLSAQLRTFVSINVASVDQLPYDEFIRSVPKMTILNVFEPYPLDGRFVMEVNPNIAYAMLDRMLGGQGEAYDKVDNLTEIETKIMTQLFQRTLETFREAWMSVEEFDPVMDDMEVNPQFLQLVSPNETVVVVSFSTTIGETSGMINICLPHVVIESILPKLSVHLWMQTKKKEPDPAEVAALESNLKQAPLEMTVELGHSEITIEEFIQLDIGDMIELDQLIDDPLIMNVDEQPKFKVQPGKIKHNLAVQITDEIEEEGLADE